MEAGKVDARAEVVSGGAVSFRCIEDLARQVVCRTGLMHEQQFPDARHAELFAAMTAFEHAFGEQDEPRCGLECEWQRVMREVGEEAERDAIGLEDADFAVAQQKSGGSAGADVGEGVESEVVGAEKGRSATDAAAGGHDGAVDGVQQSDRRFGFVEVGVVNYIFGGVVLEGFLHLRGNALRGAAFAGDIGQDESEVGGREREVKKITAGAGLAKLGTDLEA